MKLEQCMCPQGTFFGLSSSMFGSSSMTETGTASAQGSMSELIAAPSADREKEPPSKGKPVINH